MNKSNVIYLDKRRKKEISSIGNGSVESFSAESLMDYAFEKKREYENQFLMEFIKIFSTSIYVHLEGIGSEQCETDNVLRASKNLGYRPLLTGTNILRVIIDGDFYYDVHLDPKILKEKRDRFAKLYEGIYDEFICNTRLKQNDDKYFAHHMATLSEDSD